MLLLVTGLLLAILPYGIRHLKTALENATERKWGETLDGYLPVGRLTIPNEVVGSQTIRNRSKENRLRLAVDVDVDYDADLETAREVAREAVDSLDIVEETPFPSVRIEELDDSSVVLRIRFWVDRPNTEKMWKVEDEVLKAAKTALEDAGINIPYPHLRSVTDAKPTKDKQMVSSYEQT